MASPAQVSDKTRFDAAILAHFLDERSKDNGADLTESQLKSLVQNLWEWAGSQAKEARQVGPIVLRSLIEEMGQDGCIKPCFV
ncbi:MAG: hypothetical protein AAGJ29_10275, partial [Pseudomonadota bacterium]